MNNKDIYKEWLQCAKKLAIFPESKAQCPECKKGNLHVFDILLEDDPVVFERFLCCKVCESHNSMRMHGIDNYREYQEPLSEFELILVKEIKRTNAFASRAIKKVANPF